MFLFPSNLSYSYFLSQLMTSFFIEKTDPSPLPQWDLPHFPTTKATKLPPLNTHLLSLLMEKVSHPCYQEIIFFSDLISLSSQGPKEVSHDLSLHSALEYSLFISLLALRFTVLASGHFLVWQLLVTFLKNIFQKHLLDTRGEKLWRNFKSSPKCLSPIPSSIYNPAFVPTTP